MCCDHMLLFTCLGSKAKKLNAGACFVKGGGGEWEGGGGGEWEGGNIMSDLNIGKRHTHTCTHLNLLTLEFVGTWLS